MNHITPPKLARGDQVAVISPSNGLPGLFPKVYELGLERLRTEYGLKVKEYPTTRVFGSSLEDRARDIMAAFADPENKAVIASIGGMDQIQLIHLLDPQVFIDNPKPFFGYSDNTHLHNFLWTRGIRSYYGGNIMTDFAFHQQMCDITKRSIATALFETGEYEIEVSDEFNDIGLNWADDENLTKSRQFEPNEGLVWDGDQDASGVLWGGCVESLVAQLSSNIYLPKDEDLDGVVLYLETSESIPDHWVIKYILTGLGERGWLNKFSAVLVGRPKAWEFNRQNSAEDKQEYKQKQRTAVLETVRHYNKTIPVVQNLDIGHTSPQVIVPSGNIARLDSTNQQVFFTY